MGLNGGQPPFLTHKKGRWPKICSAFAVRRPVGKINEAKYLINLKRLCTGNGRGPVKKFFVLGFMGVCQLE